MRTSKSQVRECINLLVDTGRFAEAAFFARTYMPSEVWQRMLLILTYLYRVGTFSLIVLMPRSWICVPADLANGDRVEKGAREGVTSRS